MPRLVPIKCPDCGANVDVEDGADIVECTYCGTSSFIQRSPKAAPPAPPAAPKPAPAATSKPRDPSSLPAFVVVVLGVLLAAGLYFAQDLSESSQGPSADAAGEAKQKKAKLEHPVRASDPKAVEPVELIRQAIEIAKTVDAGAALISAHFPELINGVVNLHQNNWANRHAIIYFEYRRKDDSKPPGEEVTQGTFDVYVNKGGFHIDIDSKDTARHLTGSDKSSYPLPIPKCSAADAWKVAIGSGVPAKVKTNVQFNKASGRGEGQVTEWRFVVKGRNEYRREIDAATCKLRAVWDEAGGRVK